MSYQEKRAIVSLITSVVVTVLYSAYMAQRYPQAEAYSPEVFQFWGAFIVVLIGVSIVVKIVVYILFSIINTVTTQEEEPGFSDERDQLIDLKASRISLYVFTLGFLVAMIALVLNMQPAVMFAILISAGIASEMVSDLSQFFFYRRGF